MSGKWWLSKSIIRSKLVCRCSCMCAWFMCVQCIYVFGNGKRERQARQDCNVVMGLVAVTVDDSQGFKRKHGSWPTNDHYCHLLGCCCCCRRLTMALVSPLIVNLPHHHHQQQHEGNNNRASKPCNPMLKQKISTLCFSPNPIQSPPSLALQSSIYK